DGGLPSGSAPKTWSPLGVDECDATEAVTARDVVCPATSPDGEHTTRSMETENAHDAANAARRPGELAIALTGGGARAAYQVGLLVWLARRFPDLEVPILTGVSAGAGNAAHLAAH